MDTSEIYIKMCDCPEIQKQWKIGVDEMMHLATDCHDYSAISLKSHPEDDKCKMAVTVWLPRQDHIQEMLDYGLGAFVNDFNEFCVENLSMYSDTSDFHEFKTMEQLWLAFYMYEKHNKIWDDERWIKKRK